MRRWGPAPGSSCGAGEQQARGPGRRRGPRAMPGRAADGGVRGRGARRLLPQEAQRRRRHPVVVARGPAPSAPGSLGTGRVRGTMPGVRPPQGRAPGPRSPRRLAWAAEPGGTKRPRAPTAPPAGFPLHPPRPPRRPTSRLGSGVARGLRGEGPARPAELLLGMTQWFSEKALLGCLD